VKLSTQMSPLSPKAPTGANLDPRVIEAISFRARLLTRLRGEQTLRHLRKLGLRAQPPIRLASRSLVDPNFAWAVEIGAYTIIANDVCIIAHDAAIKRLTGYTEVRPVVIGERCYIGAGTIVLPGAVIGDEAIIGAGALVRGEIPPGTLAVGSPAKVIGSIEDLRERHLAQMRTSPRFERWPTDLSADDIDEMRCALALHGRIYVL
jgi:maltose O-acetyltransferase